MDLQATADPGSDKEKRSKNIEYRARSRRKTGGSDGKEERKRKEETEIRLSGPAWHLKR